MRQIPGVDHEALERLYLAASAKAQIVAAEQLLREAASNLQIVGDRAVVEIWTGEICRDAIRVVVAGEVCRDAIRAVVALREKVFQVMESLP